MGRQPKAVKLTLASASPRRRELLAALGLAFTLFPAEVEENNDADIPAKALALSLSARKAQKAACGMRDGIVIAADTIVLLAGEVLGKPRDADEATKMLHRLRGCSHMVFSGLTLVDVDNRRQWSDVVETEVWMRSYSDEEIAAYVASGDPLDKAGAYAIQYAEFRPVAGVRGCYANVMGLPICHLYRALRAWDVEVPVRPMEACPWARVSGCTYATEVIPS
ncbi:MAG: septum formation protein Maf [Chloroflexi bacterium]|nr:septum formation protein Maf [Chloroflexota bacterium]